MLELKSRRGPQFWRFLYAFSVLQRVDKVLSRELFDEKKMCLQVY